MVMNSTLNNTLCIIVFRPALKNVYMLEFHPTLAIARHIPEAIQYANWVSRDFWNVFFYFLNY